MAVRFVLGVSIVITTVITVILAVSSEEKLNLLSRQLMLQQFFLEERIRSDGHSGIKQTRYKDTGTKSYHSGTHVKDGMGVAAIHEHANNVRTCGMGEFIAVMNGVEFRTRHNDYRLRMPVQGSSETDYDKLEDIPFPEVPPEVLNQPDVDSQILEMRKWFKAWKDGSTSQRDYRQYFKPVICYLEGGWTTSTSDTIDEPFFSDRHFIDADKWSQLMEKIRYTSYTGTKSNLENYAYLPVTIMDVINGTHPVFAQWNYRIACHPIKRHLPLHALHLVDDIATRVRNKQGIEDHMYRRSARFQLNHINRAASRYRDEFMGRTTLLDWIMEEVPGKENYNGSITDKTLDGYTISNLDNSDKNAAYYHRYFKVKAKDAMGVSIHKRGFSDDQLFMAKTTQKKIASLSTEHCNRNGKQCTKAESRWTFAFPLEIVWLTPLNTWNPYNLEYRGDSKSTEAKKVTANKRNGGRTNDTAYDGIHSKTYYTTPAAFYFDGNSGADKADSAKGVVGVLDPEGNVRLTRAAGTRVLYPEIPGVGRLRQRYPIMPVHEEGSTTYKNVEALTDVVMQMSDNLQLFRKPPKGGDTDGDQTTTEVEAMTLEFQDATKEFIGPHTHSLELTSEDVIDAMNGDVVTVTSSEMAGHDHTVKVVVRENRWYIIECDGQLHCWDDHPDELFKQDI